MPISKLPEDTIRLLGSSVAISSPAAVVKELIDNAIDACATAITIFLSSDTVELIKVSDNGCGIHKNEVKSLGRRGWTSKIRHFDDLKSGVLTLGFRGDALASISCISESIVVITKPKDSKGPAVMVELARGGNGAGHRHHRSRPAGTSVMVQGLFSEMPVRKKEAIKSSKKCVTEIKDLLLAYTLANPDIKISFKCSGSHNVAWQYSPPTLHVNLDRNLSSAASQIFGTRFAKQLSKPAHKTVQVRRDGSSPSEVAFTAILPHRRCEECVKGKGAFVSVRGRPITSKGGTAKELISIFHRKLDEARKELYGDHDHLTNPFMQLNITCPPWMIDANIAPLKDDILFSHEDLMLTTFQEMCDLEYGPCDSGRGESMQKKVPPPSNSSPSIPPPHEPAFEFVSPQQATSSPSFRPSTPSLGLGFNSSVAAQPPSPLEINVDYHKTSHSQPASIHWDQEIEDSTLQAVLKASIDSAAQEEELRRLNMAQETQAETMSGTATIVSGRLRTRLDANMTRTSSSGNESGDDSNGTQVTVPESLMWDPSCRMEDKPTRTPQRLHGALSGFISQKPSHLTPKPPSLPSKSPATQDVTAWMNKIHSKYQQNIPSKPENTATRYSTDETDSSQANSLLVRGNSKPIFSRTAPFSQPHRRSNAGPGSRSQPQDSYQIGDPTTRPVFNFEDRRSPDEMLLDTYRHVRECLSPAARISEARESQSLPVHGTGAPGLHHTQTMLMRTPPPETDNADKSLPKTMPSSGADVPMPSSQHQETTLPHNGLDLEDVRDPRERLIQWKRMKEVGKGPKRIHSLRLPLETTPESEGTTSFEYPMNVSSEDLRYRVKLLKATDTYATFKEPERPLDAMSGPDTRELDTALETLGRRLIDEHGEAVARSRFRNAMGVV